MIVPTVPIVPLRRNRFTYAVLWGTLTAEVIVPHRPPKKRGRSGDDGDGQGDGRCIPIVPHLFGVSMRVSW